jgi:hypothetical protein
LKFQIEVLAGNFEISKVEFLAAKQVAQQEIETSFWT